MLSLIVLFLFGLGVAFFALQNTAGVMVNFGNMHIAGMPLFAVVVGSILFGLFISWMISLIDGVFSAVSMHGKNATIHDYQKTVNRLQERIHNLEIDNAKLQGEREEPEVIQEPVSQPQYRPSIFQRMRHSLS